MDKRRAHRGGVVSISRRVLRLIGLAAAGLALPILLHTLIPAESESFAAPPQGGGSAMSSASRGSPRVRVFHPTRSVNLSEGEGVRFTGT